MFCSAVVSICIVSAWPRRVSGTRAISSCSDNEVLEVHVCTVAGRGSASVLPEPVVVGRPAAYDEGHTSSEVLRHLSVGSAVADHLNSVATLCHGDNEGTKLTITSLVEVEFNVELVLSVNPELTTWTIVIVA
jgi:hypothetical protein